MVDFEHKEKTASSSAPEMKLIFSFWNYDSSISHLKISERLAHTHKYFLKPWINIHMWWLIRSGLLLLYMCILSDRMCVMSFSNRSVYIRGHYYRRNICVPRSPG
jgi:hypothetical protein